MKRFFKFSFAALFVMSVISAICGEFGLLQDCDFLAAISDFLMPLAGGACLAAGPGVDVNGPVEVGDPNADGKEYLDDVLKKEIVKVRPSDTPLDTLTRQLNNTETAHGIEVGGWEIGSRDVDDTVSKANTAGAISALSVNNVDMWLPGDTLQVPSMTGADGKPLTLYVIARGQDGASISVKAINGASNNVPQIDAEAKIYRLGTAASETQAQAEVFAMNPSTRKNFCQIHMTQVEESVIHGLHDKKVEIDFGTYKEQALWDFKRAMELTNLFGVKGKTYNNAGQLVYTSDGLWNQLTEEYQYNAAGLTDAEWVKMTRNIFEGNNGADRRILLAGPALLEAIATVPSYQKQLEAKNVEIVHGIRVNRIETNFGELLIKNMGVLFSGERAHWGMVLDMGNIVKKVFEPLHTDVLNLDNSGQRRVKAVRIIENYCLFAENLPTHRKLVPQV
jgi:hypothetical protein